MTENNLTIRIPSHVREYVENAVKLLELSERRSQFISNAAYTLAQRVVKGGKPMPLLPEGVSLSARSDSMMSVTLEEGVRYDAELAAERCGVSVTNFVLRAAIYRSAYLYKAHEERDPEEEADAPPPAKKRKTKKSKAKAPST